MHWILHLTMKHLCKVPLGLYSLLRNLKGTPVPTGTDSRLTQALLLDLTDKPHKAIGEGVEQRSDRQLNSTTDAIGIGDKRGVFGTQSQKLALVTGA